jgi:hypothetical protein
MSEQAMKQAAASNDISLMIYGESIFRARKHARRSGLDGKVKFFNKECVDMLFDFKFVDLSTRFANVFTINPNQIVFPTLSKAALSKAFKFCSVSAVCSCSCFPH